MSFKYFVCVALLALVNSSLGNQCSPNETGLIPHEDCTKFIACVHGRGEILDCPPGLYYNEIIEACDYPQNVLECSEGTRAPTNPTTPVPSTLPPTTSPPETEAPTTTEQPTTSPPETEAPTTTSEPVTTERPLPTLTSCGDTLEAVAGVIQYKLNQAYEKEEYCTFIIRTVHQSGFKFTLRSHGIDENTDKNAINIFTFGAERGHIDTLHLGPPISLTTANVDGAIAVIVFRTKGNSGTGFELEFEGVGTAPDRLAYPVGVNMVFNSSVGDITVPDRSWGSTMGTGNIFVFQSPNKIEHESGNVRLRIYDENLYRFGGDNSCPQDSIRVFSFVDDKPVEEVLFCNELVHKSVFQTNGMFIVIFKKWWNSINERATIAWQTSDVFRA